jgi:transcriptional regulator of acetoin/glycerol metabolism
VFTAIDGYGWPGNVREMQAVFEHAVLLASGGAIAAADLEIPVSDERLALGTRRRRSPAPPRPSTTTSRKAARLRLPWVIR